jgi:hypothetical protein
MAYANGRIPSSALASIPGGKLEKSAAAAWNAMRADIGKRTGVWIRPLGGQSSYRSYAGQQYFWNLYRSGRGNVAAYPGSSNHGWGRAVDIATPQMAALVRQYGPRYGWSWAEGRRVGEWWHFTYVGGYKAKPKAPPKPRYWYMTKTERWHALNLEKRRRTAKRNGGWNKVDDVHLRSATKSENFLKRANERLHEEAKKTGWNRSNRRLRHAAIHRLVN